VKTYNQFITEAYPRAERLLQPKPKPTTFQTITQYDVKDKNPDTEKNVEYPTRWVLPKKGIRHTTPIYHTTPRARGLEV